jgi:hypothetical protein
LPQNRTLAWRLFCGFLSGQVHAHAAPDPTLRWQVHLASFGWQCAEARKTAHGGKADDLDRFTEPTRIANMRQSEEWILPVSFVRAS